MIGSIVGRLVTDVADSINAHLTENYEGTLIRSRPGRARDLRDLAQFETRQTPVRGFGVWKLTNPQRRAGEESNYRRIAFKSVSDLSSKTIRDIVKNTQLAWSDLQVPRLQCTLTLETLSQLVVALHNSYMLPGTVFVCPNINSDFIQMIHREVKSLDYSIDPNINSLINNNFRRKPPDVIMTLDVKMNSICFVSQNIMLEALQNGDHFHKRAIVILFNIHAMKHGDVFLDGAKYISTHVVSIESAHSEDVPPFESAEHYLSKGKHTQM